jgi:hypothetical protein
LPASNVEGQLEKEKEMEYLLLSTSGRLKRITDGPIATAEAILTLPHDIASPILRGTSAKQLKDAIASLGDYHGAPTRTMRTLIKRLNDRGIP